MLYCIEYNTIQYNTNKKNVNKNWENKCPSYCIEINIKKIIHIVMTRSNRIGNIFNGWGGGEREEKRKKTEKVLGIHSREKNGYSFRLCAKAITSYDDDCGSW